MKLDIRTALRDSILGGQDGLVNVLGIILGVATATNDSRIVIIAGLAATFAESVSMAAVAYTSSKAAVDYHKSELERIRNHMESTHRLEDMVRKFYYRKGFRGRLLDEMTKKVSSHKKMAYETILHENNASVRDYDDPVKSAWIVGVAAFIGSLIPLIPFIALPIIQATIASVVISAFTLFMAGAIKAKITIGNWIKSGVEMTIIGMVAAGIGYLIGAALGVAMM
ncbi:MAG: VIT1/CCC1 transporter family protein [Candidatus Aenigmarchaeota archaeon]|nr:VIT1/CCC1 transporter family protein [Candidatus Aenigmarchaeota archaeon]